MQRRPSPGGPPAGLGTVVKPGVGAEVFQDFFFAYYFGGRTGPSGPDWHTIVSLTSIGT